MTAPFDGQAATYTPPLPPVTAIATREAFWAASPDERLAMLAFALRHMPTTHAWDFSSTAITAAHAAYAAAAIKYFGEFARTA